MYDDIGQYEVTIKFKITAHCEYSDEEFEKKFSKQPSHKNYLAIELAKSQIMKEFSSKLHKFKYKDELWKILLSESPREKGERRETIRVSVKPKK